MKEKLNNYTLVKKNKNFILNISTTSEKIITAKDVSANAIGYKNTITIVTEVLGMTGFKKIL